MSKGIRRRSLQKIRRRKDHKGRSISLFIGKTFLILIAFIILGYFIHSLLELVRDRPFLLIKNVNVVGNYPDKEEIKEWFDRYCLKEFGSKHPNILKIDLFDLKRSIETLPKVKEARIIRQFPNTILIEVKHRIPIALIQHGESILGCDKTNIFELDQPFRYDLPFITGLKEIKEERLKYARRIILEMINTTPTLLPMISEINLSNPKDLSCYTTKGTRIYFGDIEEYDLREKLVKLKDILDYTERANLVGEYVDLRFKRAVIKPRG